MPEPRPSSRDAALTELQRLHAAILASRARRGVGAPASVGPTPLATDAPSPEALAALALTRRLQNEPDAIEEPATPSRRGWWLAVAAAVIVAGVWTAFTLTQRPEVVTEAAPPAPRTAPPAAAATTPTATPPAPDAAPADPRVSAKPVEASTTPAKAVQVRLTTIRPVWMRVTVDGVRALSREVPAGETLSFDGDRAVVVRSGDAGGVQATVNGADKGPLGLRGWPLTVAITPAGIDALTPTRPEP